MKGLIMNTLNNMTMEIFYKLTIEDVQKVAMETIHRKLTPSEIEKISLKIADQIDWYETISITIRENFE